MRFARGLLIAIVSFFLWVVASIFGALALVGDQGIDAEFSLDNVPIFWRILMIIGFAGMFLGPLYYWILEPIFRKPKEYRGVQYHSGSTPAQPTYPQRPITNPTVQAPLFNFCPDCGDKVEYGVNICSNCGKRF